MFNSNCYECVDLSKQKQLNRVRMKNFIAHMTKKKKKFIAHMFAFQKKCMCVMWNSTTFQKSTIKMKCTNETGKINELYFSHRVRSVVHPLIRCIFLCLFRFLTHGIHFWQITCCTHVHTHTNTHVTSAIDNQNINYTLGNCLYWQAGLTKSEGK